ncbi:MAG: uL15m family ribosomal protein [Nanoarchaeota archaeon]
MSFKKRKKSSRYRGSHTHGRGGKKKARGSGHRGGVGMAGTGKRGDQKKTLILNLYGNDYFGKDKTLRRKPSPKLKSINLEDINYKLSTFLENGEAKELSKNSYEINLKGYKILGEGNIKEKLIIKASGASKAAVEKVKKSGGEIIIEKNVQAKKFKKL